VILLNDGVLACPLELDNSDRHVRTAHGSRSPLCGGSDHPPASGAHSVSDTQRRCGTRVSDRRERRQCEVTTKAESRKVKAVNTHTNKCHLCGEVVVQLLKPGGVSPAVISSQRMVDLIDGGELVTLAER
jgi:hypothetical protein